MEVPKQAQLMESGIVPAFGDGHGGREGKLSTPGDGVGVWAREGRPLKLSVSLHSLAGFNVILKYIKEGEKARNVLSAEGSPCRATERSFSEM